MSGSPAGGGVPGNARRGRGTRLLAIAAAVIAIVVLAGHWSGSQPRRDAVEAARQQLGIEIEARRVDVGDVHLHVVLAGPVDGPPVVLLHGFPEFWYAWVRQMGRLAEAGFRVIVPDQRGYNLSDKPPRVEDYRVETLAADIAGLIGALGYDDAHVAAHDWGGGVAWALAIGDPARVRRLAVIDTPHPHAGRKQRSEEETVNWFRTFFQIPWLPEWVGRLANWRMLSGALRSSAPAGAFPEDKLDLYRSAWDNDGAMSTMIHWYRAAYRHPPDFPDEARLAMPVLIIVAPDDVYLPGDLTRASARFLDDGRVLELEEGTHWVLQEEPDRISDVLIEFFSE